MKSPASLAIVLALLVAASPSHGFNQCSLSRLPARGAAASRCTGPPLLRMQTKLDDNEGQKQAAAATSVDEDVAKMGVELTLLKSFKDGGFDGKVKEVIAKYGKIYLGVTIVISSFNYAVCYALVDKGGPDVNSILNRLGLDSVNPETATVAANLGIAYVFYKALTPVRMPIGIALVPLIAKITGTKAAEVSESTGQE